MNGVLCFGRNNGVMNRRNSSRRSSPHLSRVLPLLCLLLMALGASGAAHAATLTVDSIADSGAGSLRQAITAANVNVDADEIVFASPLFDTPQAIDLTSGELGISQSVTITGTGARRLTVRRSTAVGTPNFRIFNVGRGTIVISGMTISNGIASEGLFGGGIRNNGGALTLNGVTVSGNTVSSVGDGGGVSLTGTSLTILNSTISGNTSANTGGGVRNNGGTVTIANSTISDNTAARGGGGIDSAGTLNLNNATITDNDITDPTSGAGGILNIVGTINTRNTLVSGNRTGGSTCSSRTATT